MSEVEKAQTATPDGDTIFGKIVRGEIPTTFIYVDEQVLVDLAKFQGQTQKQTRENMLNMRVNFCRLKEPPNIIHY